MQDKFLQTTNVRRATEAVAALLDQPPELPRLAAIHGQAGRGKTEWAIWWAGSKGGRYVVPRVDTRQLPLLNEIYAVIKGMKEANFKRVDAAYRACHRVMFEHPETPIIIDEADRALRNLVLAETLRDLSDRTGCPIIFVGTDLMMGRLLQQEQLASRLAQVVAFEPMSLDEVVMAAYELRGVNLGKEAAAIVHERTKGFIRDLSLVLDHWVRTAKDNSMDDLPPDLVEEVCRRAIQRAA